MEKESIFAGQEKDLSGSMEERTSRVKERAASQTESMMNKKKNELSEWLNSFTEVLKRTSEDLSREEKGRTISGYVETFSDKISAVSSYLSERDIDELADEGKRLIREQPAIALGAVFAAGVVVSRLLKSAGGPALRELKQSGGVHA